MDNLKTVKQIIEAAFIGRRVRFPGLTQEFQREEVHTIEKVSFNVEDFPEDTLDPEEVDAGVTAVFTTSKPKVHPHDAEKAWVYYDLTSPVEFVTEGAQEFLRDAAEVNPRPATSAERASADFSAHTKACGACEEPFNYCGEGARLLRASVDAGNL